jgi:hypothetical protein
MEFSPWRKLRSDWGIPDELLPCEGFQLMWVLEWELTPIGAGYTTHQGTWRWQALRPNGEALFDSTVSIYGTAVWLMDELVTWYIQENAVNPKIVTTVPVRPPMLGVPSDATSWVRRSDGTWANQAEAGTILNADFIAGAGLESFPVMADYQSAIYEVPLEAGALLKVPFHNVGAFMLPKRANISIRTFGSGAIGSLYDQAGFVRYAIPKASDLYQLESADGGRSFYRLPIRPSLTSPVIFKDDHNRLYCGGWKGVSYYLLISQDDGRRWEVFQTDIWPKGVTDIDGTCLQDGTTVWIGKSAGDLWCKSSRDNFATAYKIGSHGGGTYRVARGTPLSGELIISNGQNSTFQSSDGGQTWTEAGVVIY